MNRTNDLDSKIALVTGSSTGIGAAVAQELATRGAKVVLHGRTNSDALKGVQVKLVDAGAHVKAVTCDFSKEGVLPTFAEEAWEAFGGLDLLINNAGADVLTGAWAERDFADKLDYLWRVDVVGTLMLSRFIGARMLKRAEQLRLPHGELSIVNTGWGQADLGMAGDSGELFATTKGAVMAMTRSLAQTLAPVVRVNCIAPGWIRTAWGASASQKWEQRAMAQSLMRRWGKPDDISAVVAFLCGRQASFISGQVIPVDGGFNFYPLDEP